jgi:hypothetical protein
MDISLDKFSKELMQASIQFKKGKEAKKFMRKEASKLRRRTIKKAKSLIGSKSGKYLKSIKRGKIYKYKNEEDISIRAYSTDRKAHWLERGHLIKSRDGKSHGFKKGYYIFEKTRNEFEDEFHADCENFLDYMLDEVGLTK